MTLKGVCNFVKPFYMTFFKEHKCLKILILHLSKDIENVVIWLKSNDIDKISSKTSKILGLFFKLKHIFPIYAFIKLYYALFYSNVTYGIIAWGGATISNIDK